MYEYRPLWDHQKREGCIYKETDVYSYSMVNVIPGLGSEANVHTHTNSVENISYTMDLLVALLPLSTTNTTRSHPSWQKDSREKEGGGGGEKVCVGT